MKLKTLIIDDEPIALEKLRSYVDKTPFLELASACSSGFEAIEYLATTDIDLVITDINMPDLNGMDFIKSLSDPPMVIFTTAYDHYAVDSYRVSAVDYLLKPYSYVDFSRAAQKALDTHIYKNTGTQSDSPSDSIFIKVDYRYIRVNLADIRFIRGYGEYLRIFVDKQKNPLVTLSSFAAIKNRLSENFLQVHRSFIVNMEHVQVIERNRIIMDEENYIPVGDSYKGAFQQYLTNHSIGKTQK